MAEHEGIQVRPTKNGGNHYRAYIKKKINGKIHFFSKTSKSLTKAKLWRQRTLCELEDNVFLKNQKAKKHTLAEAITRYEQQVLPNKPKAKQAQQLKWWKDQIGTYSLADVTSELIAEHRDKLLHSTTRFGKKMAATTCLRYIAALSHVFTIASKEWGWFQGESPIKLITKPKIGLLRARFLSDEERTRLLKACKESTNPYLYPVVVLALATGMRRSEIFNISPASIDLINGRILLEHTKNSERRVIPLKGHALAVIKELIEQKRQNIHLLFPAQNNSQPIDLRFPWEQALKKASITNFKFHDLRHSAASYLIMCKCSLAEVAEILGHKTLAMVKRYGHVSESHSANNVAAMNEKIFGVN